MSDEAGAISTFSPSSSDTEESEYRATEPRRQRGRGSRGRGRGRGRARGRGRTRDVLPRQQQERVQALQQQRRAHTEQLIQELEPEDCRALAMGLLAREPGLVFDALMMHQHQHPAPAPLHLPEVPWCICGNCRDMPSDMEKLCCGQDPPNCVSQLPHFSLYCLDEGNLRIHRRYRDDVLVAENIREPGDDNREYRYSAYRQFIFWQHGALGQRNRLVIPSCCVWAIRDRYPDPYGQYAGFTPGH